MATPTEIQNLINSLIIDNTTNQITPAKLRQVLFALNNAINVTDPATVTAVSPLFLNAFTNQFSIQEVTELQNGYLNFSDYNEFKENLILIPNKQNYTIARTGSTIKFDTPAIYNSPSSPSTSNLLDDLTGARIGIIQTIYINKAVEPTYPGGWVKIGTGTYTPSSLNMICCEWVGGTRVNYWITKA